MSRMLILTELWSFIWYINTNQCMMTPGNCQDQFATGLHGELQTKRKTQQIPNRIIHCNIREAISSSLHAAIKTEKYNEIRCVQSLRFNQYCLQQLLYVLLASVYRQQTCLSFAINNAYIAKLHLLCYQPLRPTGIRQARATPQAKSTLQQYVDYRLVLTTQMKSLTPQHFQQTRRQRSPIRRQCRLNAKAYTINYILNEAPASSPITCI